MIEIVQMCSLTERQDKCRACILMFLRAIFAKSTVRFPWTVRKHQINSVTDVGQVVVHSIYIADMVGVYMCGTAMLKWAGALRKGRSRKLVRLVLFDREEL